MRERLLRDGLGAFVTPLSLTKPGRQGKALPAFAKEQERLL